MEELSDGIASYLSSRGNLTLTNSSRLSFELRHKVKPLQCLLAITAGRAFLCRPRWAISQLVHSGAPSARYASDRISLGCTANTGLPYLPHAMRALPGQSELADPSRPPALSLILSIPATPKMRSAVQEPPPQQRCDLDPARVTTPSPPAQMAHIDSDKLPVPSAEHRGADL